MDVSEVVFGIFASALVLSALGVVFCQRPVLSVLLLIKSFVCAAVLWMLLGAEFLSLALIFVYVGAVMTLFLFVVMMLNQSFLTKAKRHWALWPLVLCLMVGLLVTLGTYFPWQDVSTPSQAISSLSNTDQIAMVLYTDHVLPFLGVAVILLVAMVAAIALTFTGRSEDALAQSARKQMAVSAKDRLRLVEGK